MKNIIKIGIPFMLAAACSISGCSATPAASDPLAGIEKFNAKIATNLADPKVQAILQEGVQLVDLGLSIDPATAWIVPINDAGTQVIASLLTAQGLPPSATTTLINLGLKSTGNGGYAPYTAEAVSIVNAIINGSSTAPSSALKNQ